MKKLIEKYEQKLINQGLSIKEHITLGGIDADIQWNQRSEHTALLTDVINGMNINSILFAKPAEPYNSIINYLTDNNQEHTDLYPQDCETRTFLHSIPIAKSFSSEDILNKLKHKKSVIVPNEGIVTYGVVSPEQAFIVFSSVCFSLFVKFFADFYYNSQTKEPSEIEKQLIKQSIESYESYINTFNKLPEIHKPLDDSEKIITAMAETGRLTIESHMVDSFFGNISVKHKNIIYISQTGSSLDELEGYIDPCPVDDSATTGITASSEFSAHKSIYDLTGNDCILHGHPRFSVIMSMICDTQNCEIKKADLCHIKCSEKRFLKDIPIVPGEVGTGPTGLVNTLPPALTGRGAIVYGHGLFTTSSNDFTEAFKNLINIEKMCVEMYRDLVGF